MWPQYCELKELEGLRAEADFLTQPLGFVAKAAHLLLTKSGGGEKEERAAAQKGSSCGI